MIYLHLKVIAPTRSGIVRALLDLAYTVACTKEYNGLSCGAYPHYDFDLDSEREWKMTEDEFLHGELERKPESESKPQTGIGLLPPPQPDPKRKFGSGKGLFETPEDITEPIDFKIR